MSLVTEQIEKAEKRSEGLNLEQLIATLETVRGIIGGTASERSARKDFLASSKGNEGLAEIAMERIVAGNELQDVNYLRRGARAAEAIGRVIIRDQSGTRKGFGTGFLIAPGVMMTNNHVLPDATSATRSELEMDFERDVDGKPRPTTLFELRPADLFFTHAELDFSVVAVAAVSGTNGTKLEQYGVLPLIGGPGKALPGEWLTIIQHPAGGMKQVCVRENRLIKREGDVLWYTADTLGGSSGSPVFNNEWTVVALHHSGVPEKINGVVQTIDGQDFDGSRHREEDIKWIANEGIRVTRIVETLAAKFPTHPLVVSALSATPEMAQASLDTPAKTTVLPNIMSNQTTPSGARNVTITLHIDGAGNVALGGGGPASVEYALAAERATIAAAAPRRRRARPVTPEPPFPFDKDYTTRRGFDVDFLKVKGSTKDYRVNLPELTDWNMELAAKLLKPKTPGDVILNYRNMSVVMNARRRFAIYSASNVNWDGRFVGIKRKDTWRWDDRISRDAQLGPDGYSHNQFDRGHLTRWEDMEWGTDREDAMLNAADSCHWTNCATQHKKFNQGRDWWQGLEQHIFEQAVKENGFRAQVMTGPIFSELDPIWEGLPGVQYPVRFWKVAAAVNSKGALFAVAFIMDQRPLIKEFGLKELAGLVPFGPYKRMQLPISELEDLVGLKFTHGKNSKPLSDCDPLKNGAPPRDSDQDGKDDTNESTSDDRPPDGWLDLDDDEPFLG